MNTYGQTVETLCGSNGTATEAAEIAAEMNDILCSEWNQEIEVSVAATNDVVRDVEHRTAIQDAWERALDRLGRDA